MNFSEFCDNNQNIEKFNQKNQKSKENLQKNANFQSKTQNFNDDALKSDIEEKLAKYKNYNQSELTAELFKEVNKQKQSGNLNSEKLDEIKTTLLPMLDQNQQKRLESLIDMLK